MWGSFEWRNVGKKVQSSCLQARKLENSNIVHVAYCCGRFGFAIQSYMYFLLHLDTHIWQVLQLTSVVWGCMLQHKIIIFCNNFVTCHIHIGQDHGQSSMEFSFGNPKCFIQSGIGEICRALYLFNIVLQDNNVHKTR